MTAPVPVVEPVGSNPVRFWGLTAEQRLRRIAAAQKLRLDGAGEARLLVNLDFVFDPAWLRWVAERPGHVVTRGGIPVLAHCAGAAADQVRQAMEEKHPGPASPDLILVEQEHFGTLHNDNLRKREEPFLEPLTQSAVPALERISYYASYKGVTDLLTKYLWPEWALQLTRLAARLGISPNAVTMIGALLCVAAGYAFWRGWYWPGLAAGLVFMVLDTVDGKLARCTITSSRLGDILDHGIDHVHPPIWWWAWGVGLTAYGRPLEPDLYAAAMIASVGGYFLLRANEGLFLYWFRIQIHVWERLDSSFRLVSARRNPNMVILFASLLFGRPDIGFVAIGVWTIICIVFHFVRLGQALLRYGVRPLESWLQ